AAPWSAVLVMVGLMVVSAARGPAPSRGEEPAQPRNGAAADGPTTAPTAPSYPTIVRAAGREITITISAGRHGKNLFSAARHDGTVLASDVTLDELRAFHHDVYRAIQPALADARENHSAIGWAGTE